MVSDDNGRVDAVGLKRQMPKGPGFDESSFCLIMLNGG